MEKKKLCLVIPSLEPGGMERVMSELARSFCLRNDILVHIVLYGRCPRIFYSLPHTLQIHKPKTVFNDRFRLIYTLGRFYYLRKTVKKINPDSVLSFGEYWNSFVLIALLKLAYPIYISDRCSPEKKFGFFHRFLRRWLYPKAKGVIAQTEMAKRLYASQYINSNVCVIGNPIKQVHNNRDLIRENIVLTVGRLIESKHHDRLIEIFAKISRHDWKLVIVGDNAIKQKNMARLKTLIQNLNMDGKINLAGNQQDVDSYYLRSKIFASTSTSEGFPNAIGEALSAGLPVIAFDCVAGPSVLIQHEINGLLIPLFNYEAFKVGLENLMMDDLKRIKMASNASSSVSRFTSDNISGDYLNFILK